MNHDQHQSERKSAWWRDHWPEITLIVLAAVIIAVSGLGYWQGWSWTGLVNVTDPPKARLGWDWLELLIIPILLALGGVWFNRQSRKAEHEIARRERENDRDLAKDRSREEALQRYLDRMQELILDKDLMASEEGAYVREVGRARTLTVLRSLDDVRKASVLQFLHDTDLIIYSDDAGAIINLEGADLTGADLRNTDLSGADLHKVDLTGAELSEACLGGANLDSAKLNQARLQGVNLHEAILSFAELEESDLTYGNLFRTQLAGANMRQAKLLHSNLAQANLYLLSVTLGDSIEITSDQTTVITEQQIAEANQLLGLILPDGTVLETTDQVAAFKQTYGLANVGS